MMKNTEIAGNKYDRSLISCDLPREINKPPGEIIFQEYHLTSLLSGMKEFFIDVFYI